MSDSDLVDALLVTPTTTTPTNGETTTPPQKSRTKGRGRPKRIRNRQNSGSPVGEDDIRQTEKYTSETITVR